MEAILFQEKYLQVNKHYTSRGRNGLHLDQDCKWQVTGAACCLS